MNESSLVDPSSTSGDRSVVLSVTIATYNNYELLEQCLESIHRNPPTVAYEILVVDDASRDGTFDKVKENFPDVRVIRNDVNLHYATSINRALNMSRGEFLHLLNNDTIVLSGAFDKMLEFLKAHPRAGLVGCKLLNEDGSVQYSVKSLPNLAAALFGARSILFHAWPNNPVSRRHLLHARAESEEAFTAGYVSSASSMMPRSTFERVGYLDERLSYHVDADYCKRVADAGLDCSYLSTASMIHLNHRGGTMVSRKRRFRSVVEFHVGSYIYYRKHIMKSPWNPFHLVVVLGLTGRFLASLALQAGEEVIAMSRQRLHLEKLPG